MELAGPESFSFQRERRRRCVHIVTDEGGERTCDGVPGSSLSLLLLDWAVYSG